MAGNSAVGASVTSRALALLGAFDATHRSLTLSELPRRADLPLATAYRLDFSWWMTTMLHTSGDAFNAQLQLSQLRWVTSSTAGATGLAENYAGTSIGF
jgi:p-hydroxybenzoate 3-monooxygenase